MYCELFVARLCHNYHHYHHNHHHYQGSFLGEDEARPHLKSGRVLAPGLGYPGHRGQVNPACELLQEAGCGLSDRKEYYYLQEAVTAPGVVVDLNTLKLSIRVTKLGIIFLPLKS